MITTSRSAVSTYQQCPRRRYWAYEADNGHEGHFQCDKCHEYGALIIMDNGAIKGTHICGGKLAKMVSGWERKRLALPLVTGIYTHLGLQKLLGGVAATDAARLASDAYRQEVASRGLAVEQGSKEEDVVEEQAAHVEALTLGWARVRLPVWLDTYEVVETEQEDRVALSDDVTLAVRADAIVRRKEDGRMFVVNFKTVGTADERWLRAWEVDMQLMTELLAAEHRFGQEFGGVIIEGLIKGRRMPQKNDIGDVVGYADSTPLLYGYKVDANPPLTQLEYGWEYTRRKGWHKFKTWREQFHNAGTGSFHLNPLQYWINWLPEEVVESQFVVVPPIYRDRDRIEAKVMQIREMEYRVLFGNRAIADNVPSALDAYFPQNEHSCTYPSRCPMYELCWERGTADDPAGSGLYQARHDHHALPTSEE